MATAWVEQERLILLLDGLDEVDVQYRNDCIKELNQFIQDHGLTEIVVCSRIRDYENLSERLKLRSAIYVQPLNSQQIDWFLDQAGEPLSALKELLLNDAKLRAFASTPLILSIMSLSYQGQSAETLIQTGSLEERYQHLLDAYIERMFQRRRTKQQYSRVKTLYWLTWLAQHMTQTSQTVFLIERLQPSCLPSELQQILHRFMSALIIGLIVWLIVWPFLDPLSGLFLGLFLGLFFGLISFGVLSGEIETVETLKWSWQEWKKSFRRGVESSHSLSIGLFFGLVGGLRGPALHQSSNPNQGILKSAKHAFVLGLIGGLFGGLTGILISRPFSVLIGGLIGGLFGGGTACIRHFALRLMLYCMRCMPWNYAHFLDYSAESFLHAESWGRLYLHSSNVT